MLMSDIISSPRSSSLMFIWKASLNLSGSMDMAEAMLFAIWFIDCCNAVVTWACSSFAMAVM